MGMFYYCAKYLKEDINIYQSLRLSLIIFLKQNCPLAAIACAFKLVVFAIFGRQFYIQVNKMPFF